MRRVVALIGFLCLTLPALTACGSDDDGGDSGSVTVAGAFGKAPEVTYDGRVEVSSTESEVVIEGDGDEVSTGDTVFVELYVGNGYDGDEALSTFPEADDSGSEKPDDKSDKKGDKGKKAEDTDATEDELPVDQPPFMLTLDATQPFPGVREALDGVTVGSRVEVVATPEDSFGEFGNPAIGIGNKDTVVFVVDVVSRAFDGPEGTTKKLPEGLPSVVESDGTVTGLDFTGTGKPAKTLEVHTLVEGDGPPIRKSGSQVAMRYLGQVWKAGKPFDENYSATGPGFPSGESGVISAATIPGQLIKGWNEGLVGVTAGSRVMLVVPAKWGYGDQGSGEQIKPGDTLVFVVDVLGIA